MPPLNRKAFISHSSQDHNFVLKFATDLRANGVDAWYAGWEIKAGDSIRAKLDEGLAECEIFIIVLSKASINRPWIQTELDAATVRKLDGKVQKIIPIKIDNCGELPPILGSLLWVDFTRKAYDVAFREVLHGIFRAETKPPLGNVPDLPPILASRTTKISAPTAIFWTAMALAVVLIASQLTVNIGMPPWIGQLSGGVVLAGVVWLFFERIESVLNEETRREVADWLLGHQRISQKLETWPHTCNAIFERVFGQRHFSWICFRRCAVTSLAIFSLGAMATLEGSIVSLPSVIFRRGFWTGILTLLTVPALAVPISIVPCFFCLLETRWVLVLLGRARRAPLVILLLVLDIIFTYITGTICGGLAATPLKDIDFTGNDLNSNGNLLEVASTVVNDAATLTYQSRTTFPSWAYPAVFTSIWLWLYAGAGFLLKAARRFDIGFDWFNRRFDIEKKPLQSIGLVAGALVAVVYWIAVIVGRAVG